MRTYKKGLLAIVALIAVTSTALALIGTEPTMVGGSAQAGAQVKDKRVAVSTTLAQEKILKGSDGQVALALTLTAATLPETGAQTVQPVDLTIVLDRSGSMQGEKIEAARLAVLRLMERLTPNDRLALVTYSDGVQLVSPLTAMGESNRHRLITTVRQIFADGNTNLGGGLRQGIDLFMGAADVGRQRKVILISDGLANQGITDPVALGQMAAAATDHHFAVSTVGVGLDFNELLMTTIADHGTGRYYFLEDPLIFAQVFEKEFQQARQVAAAGVVLRIPLEKGMVLTSAGGYPIQMEGNQAVVAIGNLVSGEARKLFLNFQLPTDQERTFALGKIQLRYSQEGREHTLEGLPALTVACVHNPKEVLASVDKDTWGEQVVRDEYNQLKEEVADAVRKGDAQAAEQRIQSYEERNRSMNAEVGSAAVSDHLEKEVKSLRQSVSETFAGPPAAVAAKQKKTSKELQYDSYQQRRDKK
jgi:Ca-activated chloride channel family protein